MLRVLVIGLAVLATEGSSNAWTSLRTGAKGDASESMSVVAFNLALPSGVLEESVMLGAFEGDTCLGVAGSYTEDDTLKFGMNIGRPTASSVHFRLYDKNASKEFVSVESVAYTPNGFTREVALSFGRKISNLTKALFLLAFGALAILVSYFIARQLIRITILSENSAIAWWFTRESTTQPTNSV